MRKKGIPILITASISQSANFEMQMEKLQSDHYKEAIYQLFKTQPIRPNAFIWLKAQNKRTLKIPIRKEPSHYSILLPFFILILY
jgi:hypothetical protein